MRRRDFIVLIAGATAASWPHAARTQQRERMRLIGVLMGYAESDPGAQPMIAAFRDALPKLGWTEGRNLRIEFRWGGYDADRIKILAKELIDLRPDAILGQSTPVIAALARETQATPIVFVLVTDPIGSGFGASLAHPGGNITGFMVDDAALGGKWLELLKEVAPRTARVSLLFNPVGPPLHSFMPSIQAAASSFKVQVSVATVQAKDELEAIISTEARDPIGGLIVLPNVFNNTNLELIISLAARYRVPAVYYTAQCAQSGGLIAYGPDYAEEARQAAVYIDQILKGAEPADLPIQAPTKFELVVNLKTAKALGINIPSSMQLLADEVVE
jgi:putative ABC transport system substrate-binding protein